MLERFKRFLAEEHLLTEGQQVLLAVSGGRDSVTLCHLMWRAAVPFAIAHCNFHLRPGDCDRDEAFVRGLAEHYGAQCFVAQFDTRNHAIREGLSVEEAARNLRYGFFEQVCKNEDIDAVATAHHQDDAIETFFINLLRGTGIAGLRGIPVRNGKVIRPLLVFSRKEIDDYVKANALDYVEDYTNAETIFLRNRIRHDVIPLLRDISTSFDNTMRGNMARLRDVEQVYHQVVKQDSQHVDSRVGEKGQEFSIDIPWLKSLVPLGTRLFELLRPYGFSSDVCQAIIASLDGQSGKQFLSSTHRIVKDRYHLILTPLTSTEDEEYLLDFPSLGCVAGQPAWLTMEEALYDGDVIKLSRDEAWFDMDKLVFPLKLRRWHRGDRLKPFGMQGSRLVSDLLSDLKLSIVEKERVWVVTDFEGELLWVVGLRASRTAQVTPRTQRLLKLVSALRR